VTDPVAAGSLMAGVALILFWGDDGLLVVHHPIRPSPDIPAGELPPDGTTTKRCRRGDVSRDLWEKSDRSLEKRDGLFTSMPFPKELAGLSYDFASRVSWSAHGLGAHRQLNPPLHANAAVRSRLPSRASSVAVEVGS
jgi:hypothetical protein